jgi:undecaprenyl-diphosphatase
VTEEPARRPQRLLPAAIVRPAAVVAACCALAFLVLAVRYHGVASAGGVDRWIRGELPLWRDLPAATMAPLTDAAPAVFLGLAGAAALVLLLRREWERAAFAVLGPGVTMLVTEVGKAVIGRLHQGVPSLPSGHTAAVTSGALVLALLAVGRWRAHAARVATVGALAGTAVAAAVAFSLVVLGWHYASDTVAGFCVAVAGTLGAALAVDTYTARRLRPSAAPQGPADRLPQPSA